jgi:hypothetical protein
MMDDKQMQELVRSDPEFAGLFFAWDYLTPEGRLLIVLRVRWFLFVNWCKKLAEGLRK